MIKEYDTNAVLEAAKLLIKLARQQASDPMEAKMALEAAAAQIEREITAGVHAQAFYNALKVQV
jgi:hypothetical protein